MGKQLWVCKEAEEGAEAVYAAVHVVAWHRHPEEPKVLFDRATIADVLTVPEVQALVEAAQRLRDICHFLTVRQVIELGDDAIDGAGLNRWALNEGLASGNENIDLSWADVALAALEADDG